MKFEDIKWAVGTLVSSALHGPACGCPRHARLNYDPARTSAPEKANQEEAVGDQNLHGNVGSA